VKLKPFLRRKTKVFFALSGHQKTAFGGVFWIKSKLKNICKPGSY
jgi:hypothetical protein